MIGFLYSHVTSELKKLTNSQGIKLFEKEPQLVFREAVAEAAVTRTDWPLAVIKFAGWTGRKAPRAEGTEDLYEVSDITHTGTGTSDVSLEGKHVGTNSYILEITAGPNYSLKRRVWDGENWGTEEEISSGAIPGDGRIPVGDGTTFVFADPEGVVVGDTYTWQTKAYRRYSRRLREVDVKLSVEIYLIERAENFTGEDQYLDQIEEFFSEPEITDGKQIIAQDLFSLNLESLTEEERFVVAFRVSFDVSYTGGVYKETTAPLVKKLDMEEP